MTQYALNQQRLYCEIGDEATFGTLASSMTGFQPHADFLPQLEQALVPVLDSRPRQWERVQGVAGQQMGKADLTADLRAHSAPLNATAVAADAITPLAILLRALLGGRVVDQGSTVQSSSTTTLVKCASGHGSRFVVGQFISVVVSGSRYVARVTAISADDLTVAPALPGAPTTSSEVWNGVNCYPTQENSRSLTLHACRPSAAYSAHQARLRGCNGSFSLVHEINQLLQVKTSLMVAQFDGPSDLSITVPAAITDPYAAGAFVQRGNECWFSPAGSWARTHLAVSKVESEFPGEAKIFAADYGGVEGRGAILRGSQQDNVYAKLKLTSTMWEPAFVSAFDAGTLYSLTMVSTYGSGTTARKVVLHWDTLEPDTRGLDVADSGLVTGACSFASVAPTLVPSSDTASNLDLARAPFVMAIL